MANYRFSPREMKFLELYLGGALMKDAARAAGYRGATPQSLCNRGRKILEKFSKNPDALFRQAGPRGAKIVWLLADIVENSKSEHKQLQVLKILSKCINRR